jgi:hypothetical protein
MSRHREEGIAKEFEKVKGMFYIIYYASIVFVYLSAIYICRKIEKKELRKKVDTCKMVGSYASQKYLCLHVTLHVGWVERTGSVSVCIY